MSHSFLLPTTDLENVFAQIEAGIGKSPQYSDTKMIGISEDEEGVTRAVYSYRYNIIGVLSFLIPSNMRDQILHIHSTTVLDIKNRNIHITVQDIHQKLYKIQISVHFTIVDGGIECNFALDDCTIHQSIMEWVRKTIINIVSRQVMFELNELKKVL